jgi:hypothetical protein
MQNAEVQYAKHLRKRPRSPQIHAEPCIGPVQMAGEPVKHKQQYRFKASMVVLTNSDG